MSIIGLLMVAHEDDVLDEVLRHNARMIDHLYVLDGTVPNTESKRICTQWGFCRGYLTDAELPRPPFTEKPVCGYRKAIFDMAVSEHGLDNWFLILHGDEWWETDVRDVLDGIDPDTDGLVAELPLYFPREGEPWDDRPPLEQLHWNLRPGYREIRAFRGHDGVGYNARQTWQAHPDGLTAVDGGLAIRHYLYRSPDVQRARALRHVETGFDPDNYRHILDRDEVYWSDATIARYRQQPFFRHLEG